MKFCRPTFRLLHKQAPELAVKTFKEHEGFYVSFNEPQLGHTADRVVASYCQEDDCSGLRPGQGLGSCTLTDCSPAPSVVSASSVVTLVSYMHHPVHPP